MLALKFSFIFLLASCTFSEYRASFSKTESALSWDPFTYNPECPRFLISDVGIFEK